MKTTKRIAAAAASLALALSMAVTVSTTTAFADDDNVDKYLLNAEAIEGTSYTLYQIFVGNYDNNGKIIVDGDLRLGDSFQDEAQELAFYQGLELTDEADQTPAKAVAKLDGMTAEQVLDKLSGLQLESVQFGVDKLSGYYFIVETKGTGASADIASHLVKLNGNVTVTPKAGKPDVEKKVQEDDRPVTVGSKFGNDNNLYESGFNDVADAEIGQEVPFQLVGTIPTNIARFDHYFYEFTDTLEASKFADPAHLTVQFVRGSEKIDAYTSDYVVSDRDDDGTFTITFNDIKAAYDSVAHEEITPEVKVVVSYTSKLTGNASITQSGNVNEVKLTYSTETSYDGFGYDNTSQEDQEKKERDTDDTDEDGVVVFTYAVNVLKIDALTEDWIGTAEFALLNEDETQVAKINDGIITEWVDKTNASLEENKFSVDSQRAFFIRGLDTERTYKLREVTAPEGYEILSDAIPVRLELSSEDALNKNGTWTYLTGDGVQHGYTAWATNGKVDVAGRADLPVKVYDTNSYAGVSLGVKNTKHATLPETGGMGTKLFYIFGGAAVIGSSVILVARKRAKDAE